MPPTMKFIRALISAAAVVALVGCGATTSTTGISSPTPTVAPTATPVPSPTPDVAAARAVALTIIVPLPGTSGVWGGCNSLAGSFASCPFAPALIDRLKYLSSSGYFSDGPPSGVCGEDYIIGTQNGLFTAPQVLSAVAAADGSVIVVIRRGPPPPDFTVTMTLENGLWLATDLASGSGPSASIFSARPNC